MKIDKTINEMKTTEAENAAAESAQKNILTAVTEKISAVTEPESAQKNILGTLTATESTVTKVITAVTEKISAVTGAKSAVKNILTTVTKTKSALSAAPARVEKIRKQRTKLTMPAYLTVSEALTKGEDLALHLRWPKLPRYNKK
jgi:hypothetical protein